MRIIKLFFGFALILITTSLVLPQDDFTQMLLKKVREFKVKSPRIKVFLTFNQNIYAPGDTAFFAAHFLSDDLLPVAGRSVLRVELVNHAGRVIFYQHVSIKMAWVKINS